MSEGGAGTVAIDPDGAAALVHALEDAAMSLDARTARVQAMLGEAGIDCGVAASVRGVARSCVEQAADVRRRIAAVSSPTRAGRQPGSLARPGVEPVWRRLRVALGLGPADSAMARWLGASFPELAQRRAAGRSGLAVVAAARTQVVADLYANVLRPSEADARMADLDRLAERHRLDALATAAEVGELLRELGDDEVRFVADRVLAATEGATGSRARALAVALAPLRKRLREQLAASAAGAYTRRQAPDLDELTRLTTGLRFGGEEAGSGLLSALLAGLLAGDFDRRRLKGGGAEAARTAGHVLSGLFMLGDVRDTIAASLRRDWKSAGINALGLVPVAGDLARSGEVAADAARVEDAVADGADAVRRAEDAAAVRRAEESAARAGREGADLAAALKGTPLEHWKPSDPLPGASTAVIDERKFTAYSMDPTNARAKRKYLAFKALGYAVESLAERRSAAHDVLAEIRAQLPYVSAYSPGMSEHGARIGVNVLITGPNGRLGTLETRWQYDAGSVTPRLVTNFLKVHR